MIIIPIPLYMNNFNTNTQIVFLEEEVRNKVMILLQEHTSLTTKEIADAIGKSVQTTHGLLTAMKQKNKINSILTDCGSIWRLT